MKNFQITSDFSLFFPDATPAAFSEDSQEAMNNSNIKQPTNSKSAEVAEKNLISDLTGENF